MDGIYFKQFLQSLLNGISLDFVYYRQIQNNQILDEYREEVNVIHEFFKRINSRNIINIDLINFINLLNSN